MIDITKIKEKVLRKRYYKSLEKSIETREVSNHKITSVGILTTEELSKNIDLQKEVEVILKLRNPKIYSYRKFDKSNDFSYKHFSEKDINWKGQFTQTNFKSFLDQPFDLLIAYFPNNNLYLENAVLQSSAKFKVGFSNVNAQLFEMEIFGDAINSSSFLKEVKKYLEILKKL